MNTLYPDATEEDLASGASRTRNCISERIVVDVGPTGETTGVLEKEVVGATAAQQTNVPKDFCLTAKVERLTRRIVFRVDVELSPTVYCCCPPSCVLSHSWLWLQEITFVSSVGRI